MYVMYVEQPGEDTTAGAAAAAGCDGLALTAGAVTPEDEATAGTEGAGAGAAAAAGADLGASAGFACKTWGKIILTNIYS